MDENTIRAFLSPKRLIQGDVCVCVRRKRNAHATVVGVGFRIGRETQFSCAETCTLTTW